MSTQVPTIEIGDVTSHGGGTLPYGPFSIGQDLTQLLANGGNVYQESGSTIIDMDAGVVSEASPFMIGVVGQGVTCTAAVVQANQNLLDELGVYARQNGYTITLVAQNEVKIVKQFVQYFPNVQIGQWEAQCPACDSAAWWSAYDQAAAAAELPRSRTS
jgi:hypothetical protein